MSRLTYATPEELELHPQRLELAGQMLRKWTTGPEAPFPGAAMLIGRRGKVVPPQFFGKQGPEPDAEPISRDGAFLLASISKPVTYLGAMLLVERGELNLADRVTDYIPDFAAQHKDQTRVLHLFTHTSGLPDMLPDNDELRRQHAPLKKFIEGAINVVPLFPAGTQLSYQSMGTLIVAEIIQRISGLSIHDYLKREIFTPLGMHFTGLGSRGMTRSRLVRVQVPEAVAKTDYGWNSKYWQEIGAPWGGMFSPPEDFAILCQMLLNGGQSGDVRLLSPGTVAMMTTNRLDDLPELPEATRRAEPWGLGWRLNHRGTDGSWGDTLGPRVFGHTGSTGTMAWIDPDAEGFCLIFTTGLYGLNRKRMVHLSNVLGGAFL